MYENAQIQTVTTEKLLLQENSFDQSYWTIKGQGKADYCQLEFNQHCVKLCF